MGQHVVYLIPGLMCDKALWEHQAASLAPVVDIRLPVFRGFSSLRAMAEQVLATAPAHFSVVGHSMGGRIVWELLALGGNRIDKVAVLNTGAHGVLPGEPAQREALLRMARERGLQAVAESWVGPMLHPERRQDETLVSEITSMLLRNTLRDYEGQVHALLEREDRMALLQSLEQRVWLLTGEADDWSSPQQHREMAACLRSSELRLIPGAGHMSPMEQPAMVTDVLMEWLNE